MRSETRPSQDEEKNGQEPLLPPIQPVIDYGSVVIKSSRAAIHCLTIAGQIEGHMLLPNTQKATKYEHGDDDRAVGVDDHPSRAHERHDHCRAPDVPVF